VPTVYPTLARGSRGDNVKLLQEKLIELGYLNDTADGIYGAKTQTAAA
jgi:peptidoglycan hydrolase-like protein with peptidoglycan-binding domain